MSLVWIFALLWIISAMGVGLAARLTGRSFMRYFIHAVCLSPVGGGWMLYQRHRRHGPRRKDWPGGFFGD